MTIFSLINHVVDILVVPFAKIPALVGLCIISLLSAVILLAVFKKLSNQEKIKLHKNKIFGHFLEIALYRDDFRRAIFNQLGILKHNLIYLRYFGFPLLILSLPMILVCMQLQYRLGYQPLHSGDSFIIQAQLEGTNQQASGQTPISIETSDGITLETPQLYDRTSGRSFWRAKITDPTDHDFITISHPNAKEKVTKTLATTKAHPKRFTAETTKLQSLSDLLYSGENPIPPKSPIQSIRVSYRPAEYPFLTWNLSAIAYYMVLTVILGFCVKPFIKVNI